MAKSRIAKLIDRLRSTRGCQLLPPTGLPKLPRGIKLPSDLRYFYKEAGGAVLFGRRNSPTRILPPEKIERIDFAIIGEGFARGPFKHWFALADVQDGNYLAIDLNPRFHGHCYDAFHETFAMPGYVAIVASSFTDLLERLLAAEGRCSYWLEDDFQNLGEAFAQYGYKSISPQ
jgi:hypothetical protein